VIDVHELWDPEHDYVDLDDGGCACESCTAFRDVKATMKLPPRPPVAPCFTGSQVLASLGATMVMGRREAAVAGVELLRRGLPLACDIEAEGLQEAARRLKCVMFSDGDTVIILDPRDPPQYSTILFMFEHAVELIFQNSTYDVPNLAVNGLFTEAWCAKVWDTLLTARLAEPDSMVLKSLGDLCTRYLGLAYDKNGMKNAGKAVGMKNTVEIYRDMDLDRPVYARGAATDAVVTARLREPLKQAARDRLTNHPFADWGVHGSELEALIEREQILNRMSLRKSCRGMEVDLDFLDEFNAKHSTQIEQKAEMLERHGIRPGVAPDLLKWLDAAGLLPADHPRTKPTKSFPDGQWKGDKETLKKLGHPMAGDFRWHKEQTHVLKDYLLKVQDLAVERDGRLYIHPTINYLKAVTGRMSVGDPPLQQFPGGARGVVMNRRGLTSIDWSQIEPVFISNIAGDMGVLEGYEAGLSDVYTALSEYTQLPRKRCKTQLLGTLYGQGLALTAAKLGVDIPEARKIKSLIMDAMPKVNDLTYTLREIGEVHRMVPTVGGRIIPVPMAMWEGKWSVATHKAVNYFVQGGAYDILAESMVNVERAGLGDCIEVAMHDELVVESEAAYDIRRIMETPTPRLIHHAGRTPVLRTDMLDLGNRWADA
jgi:DNA polymerase-1